jgi:hypothetical protein
MPPNTTVIFLGDGEFDGTELQADLRRYTWLYTCRTASNIVVTACGLSFQVADLVHNQATFSGMIKWAWGVHP